jgi:Holliday junction DNA helicase RuvA
MIGRIHGKLIDKQPPYLLVDVQGVGYEIEAPSSTLARCPALGEPITLHTHLIVREDAHVLCGFISQQERTLFRSLIKVNSVGAKLALSILSAISAEQFVRCIRENDTAALTKLPGVGKKTAERLIIEMRDRLEDMDILPANIAAQNDSSHSALIDNDAMRDAISALVSLGYKPQEASRLLQHVDLDGLNSEAIIKSALKVAASVA